MIQPRQPADSDLPFAVDRAASASLVEQVANGLQGAVQSGAYAPGERLPGIRELARQLGVSVVVVNQAVSRLTESGLLVARRKSGIRVTAKHEKVWRAHLLWLTPNMQSYFFAARQDALLREMDAANIRTTTLGIGFDADPLPTIRAALDTMSVSVVATALVVPGLIAECARAGVPLVSCAGDTRGHDRTAFAGLVASESRTALEHFADHCRALGVTRPAVYSPMGGNLVGVESVFAARGLHIEVLATQAGWSGEGPTEGIESQGFQFGEALARAERLPELLYVTDDYAARGCLTALLSAGLRIPEDLQLVIHANRRHLPCFRRPFTRLEVDPQAHGAALAQTVTQVLARRDTARIEHQVPAAFVVGETTRPLPQPAVSEAHSEIPSPPAAASP